MKIAIIFPDYSSQFVGMGKELYDEYRLIQECFEEASNCLNINFVKLCFASSDTELSKIELAYPAIFLVSYAIGALLIDQGVEPLVVTGLGIGEYSALASVGGLSLPDGLYFLNKYAQIYQDYLTQQDFYLLGIENATFDQVNLLIAHNHIYHGALISIALTDYVVVACTGQLIGEFKNLLNKHGFSYQEVSLGLGLHSAFADHVLKLLYDYVPKIDFKDISIPLITNRDGLLKKDGNDIKDSVLHVINNPLRWDLVGKKLDFVDLIIEVGPGNKLSKELKILYPQKTFYTINKPGDVQGLQTYLAQTTTATAHEKS